MVWGLRKFLTFFNFLVQGLFDNFFGVWDKIIYSTIIIILFQPLGSHIQKNWSPFNGEKTWSPFTGEKITAPLYWSSVTAEKHHLHFQPLGSHIHKLLKKTGPPLLVKNKWYPLHVTFTLDETCLFITVIYIKLSYTIPQFNNLIDILNNIKLQRLISQIWYRNKHTRKHSGGVIRTFILPVYLLMHDSGGVIGTLISQIRYCTETNTVEG